MLGEPENQFSLTRAALSTLGAQMQLPISSIFAVFAATGLGVVAAAGETPESRLGTSLAPVAIGGQQAFVESQWLAGRVLDNIANKGRQGNGFNPLCYEGYPGKSIYSTKDTGLNFEHIFNGVAADKAISMFTPRKDPVELTQRSKESVSLHWPGERSAWGMDCRMTYTLADRDAIDIAFTVTPTRERFGQGYATLMWASYLACARDRRIYFYGMDKDRAGWTTFGEDIEGGFETGTVSCEGVKPLPYETNSQSLNIIEHPTKNFLKPFYYGLIDGDQDLGTSHDTLAYVMMFDHDTPIRFAMWNFVKDTAGKADPHRPAWDWQFVIHRPVVGQHYSYRARLVICPFTNREEILHIYEKWVQTRPAPASQP